MYSSEFFRMMMAEKWRNERKDADLLHVTLFSPELLNYFVVS